MKLKRKTSKEMILDLIKFEASDEFELLSLRDQERQIEDHKYNIEAEINRELFMKEFGYYPEGEEISIEEIQELKGIEDEINKEVKKLFENSEYVRQSNKKVFNKKNNMDFMFR